MCSFSWSDGYVECEIQKAPAVSASLMWACSFSIASVTPRNPFESKAVCTTMWRADFYDELLAPTHTLSWRTTHCNLPISFPPFLEPMNWGQGTNIVLILLWAVPNSLCWYKLSLWYFSYTEICLLAGEPIQTEDLSGVLQRRQGQPYIWGLPGSSVSVQWASSKGHQSLLCI